MKRRVGRTFLVCLLAGTISLGIQTAAVLAEEEDPGITADQPAGESLIGERIFAQCEDFVNVRSAADAESEVVARIYNNGSAMVVSEDGEWFGITSGNAVGYVFSDYFATGDEAEEIAEEVAYHVAVVLADNLNIRAEASPDALVLDVAHFGDELEIVAEEDGWLKVARGNDLYGWISTDFVECKTYYPEAKTIEEIEEEEAAMAESAGYEENLGTDTLGDESFYGDSYEGDTYYYVETYDYEEDSYVEDPYYYEESYEEPACYESGESVIEIYDTAETVAETEAASTVSSETSVQAEAPAQTEASIVETSTETVTDAAEEAGVYYDSSYDDGKQYYYDANEDVYYYDGAPVTYSTVSPEEPVTEEPAAAEPQTEAVDVAAETTEVPETESVAETVSEVDMMPEEEATVEADAASVDWEEPETEAVVADSSASAETSTASEDEEGQEIADFATLFIGNDYVYGGTSLTDGADCSGFVQSVYANSGISLSRTAADQAQGGTSVESGNLQAGDLLFYSSDGEDIDHVAIYIGDDTIVHAANENRGIVTDYAFYDDPVAAVRYY